MSCIIREWELGLGGRRFFFELEKQIRKVKNQFVMSLNKIVIFYPSNYEQIAALKTLAKVLKIDFQVTTPEKLEKKVKLNKEKRIIIDDIKDAIEELKLVKTGKLKLRNVEDLISEL
jgi:hypothetical protein